MKLHFLPIFLVIMFYCCSNKNKDPKVINKNNQEKKTVLDTCQQTDGLLATNDTILLKYANQFTPSSIELDKSISDNFRQFIQTIDINCLRQQKGYKLFITIILAKLYAYHEKCCNQGYDLLSMKEGGAKLIIDEFERILGLANEKVEFLNSFRIIDYINSDSSLKQNVTLKKILKSIKYKGNNNVLH